MKDKDASADASERSEGRRAGLSLNVASETGLLQQVMVHTPGHELELVSPENRLELLFDDILFVGHARKEHLLMCSIFEKIIGRSEAVLQIATLLRDVFQEEDARFEFIAQLCDVSIARNLQAYESDLKRLSPEELHHFALTGESPLPIHMHPLPNLLFTRDLAAVVHDHIILSHPATAARARESILLSVVLHHHPLFAAVRDRIIMLPQGVTFEGGDLLVASPELVLIGHSERTSFGGVMAIAQALFERTPVEHVLMVDLPKVRATMHLDTVFTFSTPDECVVFPPLIDRSNHGNVMLFSPGDEPKRFTCALPADLERALADLLGRDLTFIPCGGSDPVSQRREQWTDGANLFALSPGVVIGYERNRSTFEMMRRHGYRIVTAHGFLSYYEESEYRVGVDEKIAIKLEGTELSRGRGGPRCMTMPLARLALADADAGAGAVAG